MALTSLLTLGALLPLAQTGTEAYARGAVLLFLPFTPVLAPLPLAVLAGVVIAAIANPCGRGSAWRSGEHPPPRPSSAGGPSCTLALAPRIDLAVLLGVGISAAVHLWRERTPDVSARREGDTLHLEPRGVLWFGSAPVMEERLLARLAEEPDVRRVVIRCGGLGRIDHTGAYTLAEMLQQVERAGLEIRLEDVPDHAARVLTAIGLQPEPLGTPREPPS